jgi:hypothetical protein
VTDRERFVNCMLGREVDRPPFWLSWGPWPTTWSRWEREGKPADLADYGAVQRRFGVECAPRVVPVNCGPCPRIETRVLEQTAESYVHVDSWGITRRDFKGRESMSEFISFPVKTADGWRRFRDERLDPRHPDRLAGNWLDQCREWTQRGLPIQLGYYPDVGIFGMLRWLLGDEECLVAFCTQPDLVHEIMDHMTGVYLAVFEAVVSAGVRVDVIHLWEDMCGRQGPLISPAQWVEFMGPCCRRIAEFAEHRGIPLISVDTDGRPDLIVPPMLAHGVNYLFPLEVAAGCDANEYRRQWPGLALMGGIDKRALAQSRDAIDAELARVAPAVRTGRYIPDLDHLIPDDVSWDSFCHYATRLKEMVLCP